VVWSSDFTELCQMRAAYPQPNADSSPLLPLSTRGPGLYIAKSPQSRVNPTSGKTPGVSQTQIIIPFPDQASSAPISGTIDLDLGEYRQAA
jgi:hypothetical protein